MKSWERLSGIVFVLMVAVFAGLVIRGQRVPPGPVPDGVRCTEEHRSDPDCGVVPAPRPQPRPQPSPAPKPEHRRLMHDWSR